LAKEGARRARKSEDKRMRKYRGEGAEPEWRVAADKAIKEGHAVGRIDL